MGVVEKVGGFGLFEGFSGVEPPADGGVGNFRFLSGFDIAKLVADVAHFVVFDGKGLPDGSEVACFTGELGGGGDEFEELADAVVAEEDVDVGGGIGGEDAEGLGVAAQLGEGFPHAGYELEAIEVRPHHAGAAGDDGGDAALGNIELFEDFLEREVAELCDLVLLDLTDAIIRGDLIKNDAGFSEGVRDGAVKVEDQCPVFHLREGVWRSGGLRAKNPDMLLGSWRCLLG